MKKRLQSIYNHIVGRAASIVSPFYSILLAWESLFQRRGEGSPNTPSHVYRHGYQYYRMLFTYRCYGFKLTNCPHRTFSFDQFYFIVTIQSQIIIFINLFLPSDLLKGEHKKNTGVKGVLRRNSSRQILKLREILEKHVKSKSK